LTTTTACEREDSAFISVVAVARLVRPRLRLRLRLRLRVRLRLRLRLRRSVRVRG